MSKQVDKWLKKGKKNCKKDNHWFVLSYSDKLVCPVCGATKEPDWMPEYNSFLVCEPEPIIGAAE